MTRTTTRVFGFAAFFGMLLQQLVLGDGGFTSPTSNEQVFESSPIEFAFNWGSSD
jgi:hypothetical protein